VQIDQILAKNETRKKATLELIGFGRFSGFLKREVIKEVIKEVRKVV